MKVFVSNHQNLEYVSHQQPSLVLNIPFGFWVFNHSTPERVHLFPTFSPLMRVAFLGAHIDNLQVVAPLLRVSFLVLDAVPFNGPFPRALPLHDASSHVCGKNDDEFAAAAECRRSPVDAMQCWYR